MADSTIQQKLVAEVIGTFALVFLGCGSVVFPFEGQANFTITTIGLTFGITVMVMVYAFGRVSGAHFNPAVSLGAAIGGRMPWKSVGPYVIAQFAGALLGALGLYVLLQGFPAFDPTNNMGQNAYGDLSPGNYSWWAAFLLEVVMTAVFVTVILSVTDERFEHPALAPLAIGFTLSAIHFVAIPATGTSVNPVRSIAPALFAGPDAIKQTWLFILAPLVGAAIASFVYPLLFGRGADPVAGSGLQFGRPKTAADGPSDQYQQEWNQQSTASTTSSYAEAAPIIQDGWQWDPVGQQWHPVGHTPEQWAAQQAAQQAAEEQAARQQAQQAPAPSSEQQWPEGEPGDGGTQIRPGQ